MLVIRAAAAFEQPTADEEEVMDDVALALAELLQSFGLLPLASDMACAVMPIQGVGVEGMVEATLDLSDKNLQ